MECSSEWKLCFSWGRSVDKKPHVFSCSYSSQVWTTLAQNIINHRFTTSWEAILPLFTAPSSTRIPSFVLRCVFQISIHSICRERNGRYYGNTPTPVTKLTSMIGKSVRNRVSTIATTGSSDYEGGLQFWFQTHGH